MSIPSVDLHRPYPLHFANGYPECRFKRCHATGLRAIFCEPPSGDDHQQLSDILRPQTLRPISLPGQMRRGDRLHGLQSLLRKRPQRSSRCVTMPEPSQLHKRQMQSLGHRHQFRHGYQLWAIPRLVPGCDHRIERLQPTPTRATRIQGPNPFDRRHHRPRRFHLHWREIPSRHISKHNLLRHRVRRQHSLRPCSPL